MTHDTLIMIIGHQKPYGKIPEKQGFRFRQRLTPNLETQLYPPHIFESASFVWSEYSTLFENYSDFESAETVGLYHYRCILNINLIPTDCLPRMLMMPILRSQNRFIDRHKEKLIVGTPNLCEQNVLNDFVRNHPNYVNALEEACAIYDKLTHRKISSYESIAHSQRFIARNIFIGNFDFAREWVQTSHQIAVQLDKKYASIYPNNDRWGGFILERLFSVFVTDYAEQRNIEVLYRDHLYFERASVFFKYHMLKNKIVSKIHFKRSIKSKYSDGVPQSK